MTGSSRGPARLTEAAAGRLLELSRNSDGIELKLTVVDTEIRSAVTALGMDPLDARIRQVYFFETPDLRLDRHGVVVRARRIQGKGDDCVVKLRPVVPEAVPQRLRDSPDMVVEVDAMPGGYVCSASLKGHPAPGAVAAVAAGTLPLRKLLSREQRAFYAAHAPEGLELDELTPMGPINLLKLKFAAAGLGRRLVAELWLYPNGSRILELSTKCSPDDAFQAAAETRSWLASRGVDLSGAQPTKTRAALTYFSRALAKDAEAAGARP